MKNILILEDDPIIANSIAKTVRAFSIEISVHVCQNAESAISVARSHQIDLFFLDIVLPGMSGLEFAQEIRKDPRYAMAWIVFISAQNQYVHMALNKAHCFAYLVKPFQMDAVMDMLRQLSRFQIVETNPRYLTIQYAGVCTRVRVDDILYVEIMYKQMTIHMAGRVIHAGRTTLKEICKSLPPDQFVQCHRSYIVNREHIQSIHSKGVMELLLNAGGLDSIHIPIGSQYRQNLSNIRVDELEGVPV